MSSNTATAQAEAIMNSLYDAGFLYLGHSNSAEVITGEEWEVAIYDTADGLRVVATWIPANDSFGRLILDGEKAQSAVDKTLELIKSQS